jgi:hypothetical protein
MTQAAVPERHHARPVQAAPRPGHPAPGAELALVTFGGQEACPAGWEADGDMTAVPPASGASFLYPARTSPDPAGPRYLLEFTSQAAPRARLQVIIGAARTGGREYAVTAQRTHLLYDTPQHGTETARAVMTSVLGAPGDRDEVLDAAAELALVLHAAGFPWSAWDGTEAGFPAGAVLPPPGGPQRESQVTRSRAPGGTSASPLPGGPEDARILQQTAPREDQSGSCPPQR